MNIKHLRLAATFLTILPLSPREKASAEDWQAAIKYFPLVGLIFSAANIILLLFFKYSSGLSSKHILFALGITLLSLFISGGLHLDGLADSADGLAAAKPSHAETREVMRDSRVGAYGAMVIAVLLISKIACLAELDLLGRFPTLIALLILVPVLVRCSVITVMCKQQRDESEHTSKVSALMSGYDTKELMRYMWLILTGTIVLAGLLETIAEGFEFLNFIGHLFSLFGFSILQLALSYQASFMLGRRLYGHSGDSLGAGMEISELVGFLLIALVA